MSVCHDETVPSACWSRRFPHFWPVILPNRSIRCLPETPDAFAAGECIGYRRIWIGEFRALAPFRPPSMLPPQTGRVHLLPPQHAHKPMDAVASLYAARMNQAD